MSGDLDLPKYSIIIPAHNEEHRIRPMLDAYAAFFPDSEILVVLNGCTDGTKTIVEQIQRRSPNVSIIDIPEPVGKGGAVRVGFMLARAPACGYVDADGATSPEELCRLFSFLASGDAVIASRWSDGATVEVAQPWIRRLTSRGFNLIVRALFQMNYADTQCGAKIFRTSVIQKVLPSVETANFAFDVDILLGLKNVGAKVLEVPTVWKDIEGSKILIGSSSARMFASMLRLRIRHSFFHVVVPIFDRLFPTKPITAHDNLRVLFLNWRDPEHPQAGGAERFLHEVGKRWVKAGHVVEWLTASFPGAPREANVDGIKVTRVGSALSVYGRLPLEYLRNFRDRFDIIIDAENGIPFFSPLFSLKPKICLMHHVHRDVFKKHLPRAISPLFVWLEGWVMPRLYKKSRFVAVSEDTRREMRECGFSENSIGLVYNGIDASLHPGNKTDYPSVIYLGRLKPYKRLHLLVEAFSEVCKSLPDARLIIAGSGDSERALRELVERLGLSDYVNFAGYVGEDEKQKFLARSWVFVTPSEKEGWGISALEANACGTPVVAFNVSGLREAVVHGVSGVLVDEGGNFAGAITALLTESNLRRELSEGALRRARDFSWDRSAELLLDEVKRAVSGRVAAIVRTGAAWELHAPGASEASLIAHDRGRFAPSESVHR